MKNVIKYIVVSLIVTVMIVTSLTNIEALNYTWSWGGNRASWTFSDSGYVYPSHKIKMKSGDSLYYNGVVVTSGTGGGGIAASDNITFTGRDSTTDLWRFGDSVRFYDHVLFKDTLKVSNAIAIFDSAKISVDVSMLSDSSGINWTSGGLSQIYQLPSPASILAFKQNEFDFFTKKGNQILYLDSLNGMTLNYGVYTGNGSGLTSVDAITIKGQDTTHFARTDTLTTEGIKGIWGFWNTVRFYTTTTFDVSPIFSALVTFANGINVTGTATFNGDMINTGWKSQGAMLNRNKYYRDTVLYIVTTATPPYSSTNYTVAHGIANWKSIVSWDILIHDDSLNIIVRPNLYPKTVNTTPYLYNYACVDSLNAQIHVPAAAVSLFNDTCTVFIRYTDYNR